MNYSTTEYKSSPVAPKVTRGAVTMVILTVAMMAAMVVQFAQVV